MNTIPCDRYLLGDNLSIADMISYFSVIYGGIAVRTTIVPQDQNQMDRFSQIDQWDRSNAKPKPFDLFYMRNYHFHCDQINLPL